MSAYSIQATHPCALCGKRIFGPHHRVYPRPPGSGTLLVCDLCGSKRTPRLGEEWFYVPYAGVA